MDEKAVEREKRRRGLRRALWLAAAGAACFALYWVIAHMPRSEDADVGDREFLEANGQSCSDLRVTLNIDAERLLLQGTAHATVRQDGPIEELRFLLHHSLRLDRVLVGNVAYIEERPWFDAAVSIPRHRRRLVADSDENYGRELPHDGLVQIHFQGSALSVAGSGVLDPLPLIFTPGSHYAPVLAADAADPTLELILPELSDEQPVPWSVFTDLAVEESEGVFRLSPGQRGPSFAVGPLEVREYEEGPHRLRIASTQGPFPTAADVAKAITTVSECLPEMLPNQLSILIDGSLTGQRPSRLGGGLIAAAPLTTGGAALVRVLATAALPLEAEGVTSAGLVPDLVALQSLSNQSTRDGRIERAALRAGSVDPVGFDAWLAVQGTPNSLNTRHAVTEWARRWVTDGEFAELRAQESESQALLDWVRGSRGVNVRFGPIKVNEVNQTFDLRVEIELDPPPRNLEPPPLELMVVTRASVRSVPVSWRDGRAWVSQVRSDDAPLRLVLDPSEQFPDLDRSDNVLSLVSIPEPAQFACNRDTTRLALAPRVVHRVEERRFGVYVYDLDLIEGPKYKRWYELPGPLKSLRWIDHSSHLFLEFVSSSEGRFGLLDLEDGRLRRFEDACSPDSSGEFLLLNREQAEGRWRHRLYSVESGREVPLLNDFPGRLRWVEGADLLLASSPDGLAELRSLAGEELGSLGVAAEELRLVRRSPHFVTYVTENATGSVLRRLTGGVENVLYQSRGRLIDYAFSTEPGDIEVIAYERLQDGNYQVSEYRTKTNRHRILYQAAGRPLEGLHLPSCVLVSESPELGDSVTAKLQYCPFPRTKGEPFPPPITFCEQAFLDPPPSLSSFGGRFVYYVRTEEGDESLPDCYRRRALYRYDIMEKSSEPVFSPRS